MTTQIPMSKTQKLYEEDFYLWIENTIQQIRKREFELVDWEHLLEELESLGKSDRRELYNRLIVLLEHFLKLAYWKTAREENERLWKVTIREQRNAIEILLDDSPSLKSKLEEFLPKCYQKARIIVFEKASLSEQEVPLYCPFTIETLLNSNDFPEVEPFKNEN